MCNLILLTRERAGLFIKLLLINHYVFYDYILKNINFQCSFKYILKLIREPRSRTRS